MRILTFLEEEVRVILDYDGYTGWTEGEQRARLSDGSDHVNRHICSISLTVQFLLLYALFTNCMDTKAFTNLIDFSILPSPFYVYFMCVFHFDLKLVIHSTYFVLKRFPGVSVWNNIIFMRQSNIGLNIYIYIWVLEPGGSMPPSQWLANNLYPELNELSFLYWFLFIQDEF